jgi:hypothetical protein
VPPVDHELNLTMQAILTYVSWGLTAVILVLAIWLGMRERTPFYALMVFAAGVGAFAEPLYDVGMMLYFYSTEGMWTHFTAFDIPQPIWTHSGYVVLYAAPAIYITHQIARGTMTRTKLFVWAGITLLESAAFEIVGINGGLYTYWGPHVFRILEYPLVIGVLEAAQVICFAVAASQLRARCTGQWQVLGLFVLFPCTFYGQLRRGLAHDHRNPPRKHFDDGDCSSNGREHRLRGGAGAGDRLVPAAAISCRCRGSPTAGCCIAVTPMRRSQSEE